MSKENNLTDFLTDVADAIRNKKGTTEKINPQDFSDEIKGIKTSTSIWTGHADVEGLKAIGWDDEDIAYYQEHGVNWMEEDDEYHKVSDDNKALYGVVNLDNIQEYKDRIIWLPKIGEGYNGQLVSKFRNFTLMKGLPKLNLHAIYDLSSAFFGCTSLTCIPPIDTLEENVRFSSAFRNCTSLLYIPPFTCKAYNSDYMCYSDTSLEYIQSIDIREAQGDISYMYGMCRLLKRCGDIDAYGLNIYNIFYGCTSLSHVNITNLCSNLDLQPLTNTSKSTLLYMINNEAATEAITITLSALAYTKLATDPDIVEALSNHPLVSLASA